ncbi:FadR family transcriptional regulator [Shewanella sp. A3A]|uniref:FadR family transcriptional regulator n=1 Tax=Shewanella electrica TaxID=515560 RepID=A0ABT2FM97_9GAMM|nr:FadR/GntR family transcriptional regulator [Shewanella electrica]MCH1919922.1 FadR family transcriptional regulator [Shewanella ferrihydritica]MCH1925935.1 FadR family transcriptional regulator [Shewanella electrica]MCS4557459.1 FadR family transcriptional regulator [Shewanella electrica]
MEHFKPIKQVKASEEVAQQLRTAIFDGTYPAGHKLPSERELIESFMVSRTVVREAVKGLEASGLVEVRQGATGGAFVKSITFERMSSACNDLFFMGKLSFTELCEARLLIEPMIARMAARNCTPEDAQALMRAHQSESDTLVYPETVELRQKVHHLLADMTGNRFLAGITKSLLQVLANITNQFEPDTDIIHPAGLHLSVINAVIANDEDAAAQAMYSHLKGFLDRLKQIEADFRNKSDD